MKCVYISSTSCWNQMSAKDLLCWLLVHLVWQPVTTRARDRYTCSGCMCNLLYILYTWVCSLCVRICVLYTHTPPTALFSLFIHMWWAIYKSLFNAQRWMMIKHREPETLALPACNCDHCDSPRTIHGAAAKMTVKYSQKTPQYDYSQESLAFKSAKYL